MPLCYYSFLSPLIFFLTKLQYTAVSIQVLFHQDIILGICFGLIVTEVPCSYRTFQCNPYSVNVTKILNSEIPGNYPKREASMPATLIW